MKFYLQAVSDSTIIIRARMEGDGGIVGDFFRDVQEGDSFCGVSFSDLKKEADEKGFIDIPDEEVTL